MAESGQALRLLSGRFGRRLRMRPLPDVEGLVPSFEPVSEQAFSTTSRFTPTPRRTGLSLLPLSIRRASGILPRFHAGVARARPGEALAEVTASAVLPTPAAGLPAEPGRPYGYSLKDSKPD